MKLHYALFGLLILLLPVQLGKHFWPDFSFINGIRVDYLSPTVYLTDLVVTAILLVSIIEQRGKTLVVNINNILQKYWLSLLFFTLLFVGILGSENSAVGFIKLVKVVELVGLGIYVKRNLETRLFIERLLPLAALWSILLATFQFIEQKSIGGIFWWFGERTFSSSTPGIALAVIDNQLILRPYATFPHPNVFAGFILFSVIIYLFSDRAGSKAKRIPFLAICILGLLFSFSRSSILAGIVIVILYLFKRISQTKRYLLSVGVGLIIMFGILFLPPKFLLEDSTTERMDLIYTSATMIKSNPFFGVGLNNFIVRAPDYWAQTGFPEKLQPVHNVYLLVLAETGILTFLLVCTFLVKTFKRIIKINGPELLLILAISIIGIFDHYWLTLQQGQILLAIVLGLCWQSKPRMLRK